MFALKSVFKGRRRGVEAPIAADMRAFSGAPRKLAVPGIVLPRFLRWPVRWAARAVSGETEIPRFAATVLSASFLASAGIYGMIAGNHLPSVVQAVTARTGFAIEEIRIKGHEQTSEIDILGELELDGWTSLLGFDVEDARTKIAALPWVESVSVRKSYPSMLEINIVERKPFAIWQSGSDLSLIEESGNVITAYPGRQFAALPLVIGLGAPENATEIIGLVGAHPEIASRIKAFIRVANRRWDLRLENGVTVKLPGNGVSQTLTELVSLDNTDRLLSRDISAIDMRFGDRFIVQLTPEAAVRRNAMLEERARRKPEKSI